MYFPRHEPVAKPGLEEEILPLPNLQNSPKIEALWPLKLKFCKERSHLVTLEFLSSAFLIQASDEWSITIRNSPQQWSILGAVLSSARSVLGAAGNTRSVKSNPGNSVPADDIIRRIQDYSPSMYTALRMMRITLLIIHMMTGLVAGGDVCYDHLGCFSDSSPWSGTLQRPHPALPWSPEKINTKFLLFTRELVSKYQIISGNNITSITSSTFRTSRASCLIVHGMADRAENNWVSDMCQAILAAEDVNCVGVDWRSGSGSVALYVQAANNARLVGAEIAYMLRRWQQELEYPPAKVHIIGHSLGAHAAGEAGWRLPGIRRITGLDPARPWFENTPEDVRLDPSDADFVDVIHTDTNKFTGVGIIKPIGHFDFYPNGGRHMTGCPSKLAILTNKG
ncbi:pancreatic triacylglycerol lipase-like, partial [Anomaloglossus baeobatrachus]|uniref:pancreatic triacylglycerol lipase-like n=1 Tax=Anomaloglossus baeobatrachus TaxID=238106 RepID=UPI003F509883